MTSMSSSRHFAYLPFSEWTDEELESKAKSFDHGVRDEISKRAYFAEKKANDPNFQYPDPSFTTYTIDENGKKVPMNSKYFLELPLVLWTQLQLEGTSYKYNQGIPKEIRRRKKLGIWKDGEENDDRDGRE